MNLPLGIAKLIAAIFVAETIIGLAWVGIAAFLWPSIWCIAGAILTAAATGVFMARRWPTLFG